MHEKIAFESEASSKTYGKPDLNNSSKIELNSSETQC